MNSTKVTADVSAGRRRVRGIKLLVDSGAAYSVLPERVWRKLGLAPFERMEFEMADGTSISRGVAECVFHIKGKRRTSPVVLGGRGDVPLLGVITLETMGLMLNPLTRETLPMRLALVYSR